MVELLHRQEPATIMVEVNSTTHLNISLRLLRWRRFLAVSTSHSDKPTHAAYSCEVQQSFAATLFLADALSENVHCDQDPDLVSIFEAVCHSFCNAVYPYWHAINSRVDHALCQRISRESDKAHCHAFHDRLSRLAMNRHPDHVGVRVQNSMKSE